MTEPNDRPTELPVEAAPLKTHKSGKFFRLGIACLALLLVTALILIGGSFSKIISKGTITGLTLQAEGFDIEAEAYDYSNYDERRDKAVEILGDDGNDPCVICSFTVTNHSQIDALLDIVIETEYSSNAADPLNEVAFFLYIGEEQYSLSDTLEIDQDGITCTITAAEDSDTYTVTVNDYLLKTGEDDVEFVFLVKYTGEKYPNNFSLTNSGNGVTITAKQVTKGGM